MAERKSYNGYNFTDGVKFESWYKENNGIYTEAYGQKDIEESFNKMYFNQTEGIYPTLSYKTYESEQNDGE